MDDGNKVVCFTENLWRKDCFHPLHLVCEAVATTTKIIVMMTNTEKKRNVLKKIW